MQNVNELYKYTKLLTSFEYFTRYFYKSINGKPFIVAPHHKQIIETLHKVVRGEIKRLIINIPPRYGKTEIAVKMFVAWCLANNPNGKFIHLSYSDDLALDNSSAIREVVKSEEYQKYFPTKLKSDSDSKKKWYTENGGGLYATNAGGAITGFGAGMVGRVYTGTGSDADGFGGCIILDDPLKPDDAYSDVRRDMVNRRYNNTILSRCNSMDTPIIVIMQRLHVDDMTGYLLNGGSGEEWTHLCLPAINEDGTSLWEEKLDIETLRKMEAASSYTFAGQYMQRPSPLGGGLIKGAWFGRYTVPPIIKSRKIFADTAQKTAEHNDYTVLECWGHGSDGKLYLLDMLRGKWEAPELRRRTVDFWNKHKGADKALFGTLRQLVIEDKASGTGLIQDIKKDANIPIFAMQRNKDKLTRVMDVVSYIESGYIMLPNADYVSDFINECESFTPNNTHKHDDQIDPMCDAIVDAYINKQSFSITQETIDVFKRRM